MPFIEFDKAKTIKIKKGIEGKVFHSEKATFVMFYLKKNSVLPKHTHHHEQCSNLIKGELEFTIGNETKIMKQGMTALIPSNIPHSVKAISDCQLLDCFIPVREDFKSIET